MVELILKIRNKEYHKISKLVRDCNLVRIICDGKYIMLVFDTNNFNEINYLVSLL